jgi:hypothetical protein
MTGPMKSAFAAATIITAFLSSAVMAASKPNAPPSLCVQVGGRQSCTPGNGSLNGSIKWHPGHYMASNSIHRVGTAVTDIQFELDAVGAAPKVMGWRGIYTWAALEPTKGQYDFSTVDAELAILKTQYKATKRLGMVIWPVSFGAMGSTANRIVPQYILSDPQYGPGTNGINYGYATTGGSTSTWAAALWRPAVMDRFIALIRALGAHLNSDPNFEVLMLPETSSLVGTGASDYSEAALVTQLERLISAAVAAFPNTNVVIQDNFMQTLVDTGSVLTYAQAHRAGLSGPDIWGASAVAKFGSNPNVFPAGYTWGQICLLGLGGTNNCNADLRGQLPVIHDIQEPEMDGTEFQGIGSPFTLADLFDNANGNLHASHLFWTYLGNTPGAPGTWPAVVAFSNSNPITHTECPANYGNRCNVN